MGEVYQARDSKLKRDVAIKVLPDAFAADPERLGRQYDPWGNQLSGASAAGYAFQGREWDSEISLYYFRARYYNAATGAWAADDPIGVAGGANLTQFVNNNPLRFVDPFGLCGEEQGSPDRLGRYNSIREAGRAAVKNINPTSIKEDREYAGVIYRNSDGSYDYTQPRPGGRFSSHGDPSDLASDQTLAGAYHTHGDHHWNEQDWNFSSGDKKSADQSKVPMYLGNSFGAVLEYDPGTRRVTNLDRGR